MKDSKVVCIHPKNSRQVGIQYYNGGLAFSYDCGLCGKTLFTEVK